VPDTRGCILCTPILRVKVLQRFRGDGYGHGGFDLFDERDGVLNLKGRVKNITTKVKDRTTRG